MKHKIKIICFEILLALILCFFVQVFFAQGAAFPNDPRAGSAPEDLQHDSRIYVNSINPESNAQKANFFGILDNDDDQITPKAKAEAKKEKTGFYIVASLFALTIAAVLAVLIKRFHKNKEKIN